MLLYSAVMYVYSTMFDKVSLIFLILIDHKLMIEDLELTLVLKIETCCSLMFVSIPVLLLL